MKRVILVIFLAILILAAACSKQTKPETSRKKMPILIQVAAVKKGEFNKYLHYKGTVDPWRKANIIPDVAGRVDKIFKKQGDMVGKGELLAELDTTTLKLQLKQAEAGYAVADASYKDASLNYKRFKKLFEKKAISQIQLEKAQLGLEAADTQRKSSEANLNVIKHTLGNAYMKAPFSGVITAKYVEEGDMINPMMGVGPGILSLMDLSEVKVILAIPAEDIETVMVGQRCEVVVNSLPDVKFEGRVFSKNLAADPISKTFKVEIQVNNPQMRIKAGIFAEVNIETYRNSEVMMIPLSALIDNNFVILFDNGKAKKVKIVLGEVNNTKCEVLAGLQEGDQVIIEGNYDLKDGSPVKVAGAVK